MFSRRFRMCGLLSDSLLTRGIVAVRPRHPVLRPLRLVRHRRFLQILGHLPVRMARQWESSPVSAYRRGLQASAVRASLARQAWRREHSE